MVTLLDVSVYCGIGFLQLKEGCSYPPPRSAYIKKDQICFLLVYTKSLDKYPSIIIKLISGLDITLLFNNDEEVGEVIDKVLKFIGESA